MCDQTKAPQTPFFTVAMGPLRLASSLVLGVAAVGGPAAAEGAKQPPIAVQQGEQSGTTNEEDELRNALDAYRAAIDSLYRPPAYHEAIDAAAAIENARVRITNVVFRDGSIRAIARYRQHPTTLCQVLVAIAGTWRPPESEPATPATCEAGSEAVLKAALWEFVTAQANYMNQGHPLAIGVDLDPVPPPGVTTTILTVKRSAYSAIATQDTVPDLVCGIRVWSAPAPLRDDADPRIPTCARDPLVAAKSLGRPPPPDTVAALQRNALAVGGTHACAINDEGVICWGDDRFGQLGDGVALGRERSAQVVTDAKLRSLAAGYAHTCGLDADGRAYCWGDNVRGQLGDGTYLDRATPAPVTGPRRFVSLAAGSGLSCGMTADGAVYCWGLEHTTPQAISSPVPFQSFASTACGVSVGGALYCWLDSDGAQWINGTFREVARAAPTAERFRVVAEGHGIPRLDDIGYWATDSSTRHLRRFVVQDEPFQWVRLRSDRSCGLSQDGRVLCWKPEEHYVRPEGDSLGVVSVPVSAPVLTVVAGARHSCGLAADGTAYCWVFEEIAPSSPDREIGPPDLTRISDSIRFQTLAAYGDRTCGMALRENAVFCWHLSRLTPTHMATQRADRIRVLATDFPSVAPRDTSTHWGFILPEGLGVRFEGPTECAPYGEPASEGPDGGQVFYIEPRLQLDLGDLSYEMLGAGPRVLFGGFRWRVVVGDRMVRVPILDDEGNPVGQDAFQEELLARGAVFPGGDTCIQTLEHWESNERSPAALIDVVRALRYPVVIDSSSLAANARGMARYRAGNHAEALAEFKRAVALDDENAEAVNNVGFVLYRLGRLEESVTWFRRAMEIDPGRAVAYLNLGDSLEELGYHPEAVAAYERYLGLEPKGTAAGRVRELIGSQSDARKEPGHGPVQLPWQPSTNRRGRPPSTSTR